MRAMDSLQASLEAESRAKAEALRIKKKLESDINELEIALDHANKANAEAHKSIKRYQAQLRDVEGLYEEEGRQRREIAEKAGLADRRANALQGELEEARALLDSADRGKKQADMELVEYFLRNCFVPHKEVGGGLEREVGIYSSQGCGLYSAHFRSRLWLKY